MNKTTNTSLQTKHILSIHEEQVSYPNLTLHYRLTAVGNEHASHFLISVCANEERAEINAGKDLLRALAHFRRIADGHVTPCTLCDVLCDLQYMDLF